MGLKSYRAVRLIRSSQRSTISVWMALAILSVSGCKKFDENKPEIVSIQINGTSSGDLQADAGGSNEMSVSLKDNEALSQILVKFSTVTGLHDHSHNGAAHIFTDYNQGAWDTVVVSNLNGKETLKNYQFQIPDDVSGGWNLEISALDESGNLVTHEEIVHIINGFAPSISVSNTTPVADADGIIHALTGESVSIEGIALDADSLSYVKATMYKNTTQTWTEEFTSLADVIFDLATFQEPIFTEVGTYYYQLESEDIQGYYTKVRAIIKVE